jgi:RNA polymerase sigma-70 factor, ECF subfamily
MSQTPETHAEPGFLQWVAELVHLHRHRLLSFARGQGLDAEAALDCVQDAFVSFMKLPQARTIARVEEDSARLLFVLLKHIISNQRRTQRRRERLLAETPPEPVDIQRSEQLIADAEHLGRLYGCILRMTELQRRVIELSLLDDYSGSDLAEALDISPANVRVLLFRARAHLRSCNFEDNPSGP